MPTAGARSKPFVPLNCAALPRDLVESELFGHRRGAFSGAHADHPGLFVGAHGGTLFLDEIGELPAEAQAKLLRVLQDGEVRPVGGLESRKVDVRIIAASNRSLAAMGGGAMRQDLFFRLSVLVIELPPLRERIGRSAVAHRPLPRPDPRAGDRAGGERRRAGPGAAAGYPFPGNVRELENMLEGISLTLPPDRRPSGPRTCGAGCATGARRGPVALPGGLPAATRRSRAWAITEALKQTQGNKRRAAELLGISRDTLYRKLHELGLGRVEAVRFSYIAHN